MKNKLLKVASHVQSRIGFFALLVLLLWIKTIFAYLNDFHLILENGMQIFLLLLNPFPTAIFLLG
ncbi:MAG: hypothetical protein LBD38_00540, partial [Streptococcaceae bacterium]|nr:hypothetical protein [Streptococcaceae bacterium]